MPNYCNDDEHNFTKLVTQNQVMYVCKKCAYIKGYVRA